MEGSKFHFSKCSIIMIPILTKKLGGKWGGGSFLLWGTCPLLLPCSYAPAPCSLLGFYCFIQIQIKYGKALM